MISRRPVVQVCLNGARIRADHPRLPVSLAELAAAALTAVRGAVPGIPVGVTTGAWTTPDPEHRAALVRGWTVLPDHASGERSSRTRTGTPGLSPSTAAKASATSSSQFSASDA